MEEIERERWRKRERLREVEEKRDGREEVLLWSGG